MEGQAKNLPGTPGLGEGQEGGPEDGADQNTDIGGKIPEGDINICVALRQIDIEHVGKNQAGADRNEALHDADCNIDPFGLAGCKGNQEF